MTAAPVIPCDAGCTRGWFGDPCDAERCERCKGLGFLKPVKLPTEREQSEGRIPMSEDNADYWQRKAEELRDQREQNPEGNS